ncbi:MAG: hypothetical protein V4819_10885 [Verrucomicrobiota bacterium]
MKRACTLIAPPLAFVLTALLAWLTESPGKTSMSLNEARVRSPRQREAAALSSGNPVVSAAQFENEMLVYRAPPKEIHDAEWMEGVVAGDRKNPFVLTCSTYAFQCTLQWAEESPAEMFAWLIHQGGSDFRERESAASTLFQKWAEKDMEAALGAVFKIANKNIRRQALASSLEVLNKSNPNRAGELLMQNLDLFPPDLEGSVFNPYNTGKATCDLLLSLPPGVERTHLLANLLTNMALGRNEETANAISLWKQAPEAMRRELVSAGFSSSKESAASFDGIEALSRENAEASNNPAEAVTFMKVHGPAWAKSDLVGALDWTESHVKGKKRIEQSVELFAAAARGNLDVALQHWQTLPEGILKSHAAKAVSENSPADRRADVDSVIRPRPAP